MKSKLNGNTLLLLASCLVLLAGCAPGPSPSPAPTVPPGTSISGLVFRDLDSSGTRDLREPGEPDVTVSAYDANNRLVASATTDIEGRYTLNAGLAPDSIVAGEEYLLIFSGWASHLVPGPHGPDSGTEQQFVAGGATDANFGLFNPDQYVPPEATAESVLTHEPTESASPPTPAAVASPGPTATSVHDGTVSAPSFPAGLEWLNTRRPLTLADLRGKVVLLEFWTYGCINCIQSIPQLKMLEAKYAGQLVVIGVHSAKFPHESDTENLRHVVQRYEIDYPVINDRGYQVAGLYGANVWPTFTLINPLGRVLGSHKGNLVYSQWDRLIGEIVADFEARDLIDRTPLDLDLESETAPHSPLRFPTAILADEANDRLFIVDSNHNRIVIADLAGVVQDVIGNGQAAWQDGEFETASFFHPQGLTLAGEQVLYVADTENHLIRRVDLQRRLVETVAGVGEQIIVDADSGPALKSRLSSPWDVLYVAGLVYVPMAGKHQIWTYDPASEQVQPFAGAGVEELTDGPLLRAGFNQPTALTTDGAVLYVADSEASAIRQVDLDPAGEVRTLVGGGFWVFGDADGVGDTARLQRPAGIAYRDGLLYVADTYNNKIKTVDPESREVLTFLGSGESGWRDGAEPLFNEPIGLSFAAGKLYIADANNHVVRVADLATRQVATLVLVDPDGLLTRAAEDGHWGGQIVTLEPQTVLPGEGTLRLDVRLPEGYKLNDLAPSVFRWYAADATVMLVDGDGLRTVVEPVFPLDFAALFALGSTTLTGEAAIYYCQAQAEQLCLIEQVRFILPVTVGDDAESHTLQIDHTIISPDS